MLFFRTKLSNKRLPLLLTLSLAALLAGCAPSVTTRPTDTPANIATEWIPSPNFEPRKPNFIILHHTSDNTAEEALRTLTSPSLAVSSHYLIGRDGKLYQLVDERQRAWHAGQSWWGGQTDMNSASIGIELDNNGFEPFPDAQIETLVKLLEHLQTRYNIPSPNILGHADIAPGRKTDPSALFPWHHLANLGFGRWCEPPYPEVPENFDPLLGLTALGYDIRRPNAAISAFKLHFSPEDPSPELTETDRARLYCVLQQ